MSTTDGAVIPWSPEAEQSLLGAAMLEPDALSLLADVSLSADHFFDHRHRDIWAAIVALWARREPADPVSVFEAIAHKEGADLAYLNALCASVYSGRAIAKHAAIVVDKAMQRDLCAVAQRATEIAAGLGTAAEKLDAMSSAIGAIQRPSATSGPREIAAVVMDRIDHWQNLADGTVASGISTGLDSLDRVLGGGLKPGRVLVVAARPSVGKTSLATQILLHVGQQHQCLFLSQEMTAGELVDRMVSNVGRVNLGAVATGRLSAEDSTRLAEAASEASRLRVHIDDTPSLSLLDIRARARRVQQQHGLSVVVLDYLQLSRPAEAKQQNRHHQIEAISRGLKELAKELGIAVILLSQVNRQSTARADGEPTLADLKESGAIEEDADTVILLHPLDKLPDGALLLAAIVAKNRHGRRVRLALSFDGATQRWAESQADVSTKRGTTT